MAHAALHFSVGMVTGMGVLAPRVLRALRARAPTAAAIRQWVVAAWLLGVYALVPSFLPHIGLPTAVCDGWWINVFLFHPLLNVLIPRGTLLGELTLLACLAFQYACVLAALIRAKRMQV